MSGADAKNDQSYIVKIDVDYWSCDVHRGIATQPRTALLKLIFVIE
jgi:hypothetical protein